MPETFSNATDAAAIGKKIIKQHHDHLISRRVEFLFVERFDAEGNSQAIMNKGKSVYGRAKLVTGLNAYLAAEDEPAPFFVILITKHFWEGATKEFKEALVDHELAHCWYDSEKDRYSMIDHDVAEFTAIVKRHGAWKADLDLFFKAAKQQKIPFADTDETKPPATRASRTTNVTELPPAA